MYVLSMRSNQNVTLNNTSSWSIRKEVLAIMAGIEALNAFCCMSKSLVRWLLCQGHTCKLPARLHPTVYMRTM